MCLVLVVGALRLASRCGIASLTCSGLAPRAACVWASVQSGSVDGGMFQRKARQENDNGEYAGATANPLQAKAICSSSDAVLLLSSPGTGKTRVLRARMAYLLLSQGVEQGQILGVTFTQHAAQQLKARVGALAGTKLDEVWLGTFHSICARMLHEHASKLPIPVDFDIANQRAQLMLLHTIMRQVGMTTVREHGASHSAVRLLRRIQMWKESGLRPSALQLEAIDSEGRYALALYPEYQRRLLCMGLLDYSDLALSVLKLFSLRPDVLAGYRRRFRHVLVDELQDTSAVQYAWLRQLTGGVGGGSIFCAADDDQAIYSWRGAQRDNVLRFMRDWPAAEVGVTQGHQAAPDASWR